MRKAPLLYLILAVLLVTIWYLNRSNSSESVENKSLADRVDQLVYTRHGKCRMECRQISEEEVKEIIRHGTINRQKSDPADKPCPTIALEGISSRDQQHIRVVLADCDKSLKLVTCIDLKKDHSCNCR